MNEFQRTSRTTRQIARCTGIALTSIALGGIGIAHAQDKFPSRPVRIIVAFAPGGGTDIIARSIAAKLTTRYQQQFIVDNRPGGGGNVGMEIAARAVPDGYTLLAVSSSYAANAVMRKTAYDPITGFDPVSLLSRQAVVLLAHPSVPVTSVKDLIALAKAKPGTLTYGSSGSGGIQHLATELFKSMAQVDIVHVPYKGTGPALNDLMAGQINLSMLSIIAVLPHVRSGKLKGLAVSSATRSSAAPDIPTLAEAGVPGYAYYGWYCILAPAKTPRNVRETLSAEMATAMNSPEVRDRLTADGSTVVGSTPDQLGTHIRTEVAKLAKLVKDANIRID
jgi:tripartite-type tricarboxylate transporter receptor subunit TctC